MQGTNTFCFVSLAITFDLTLTQQCVFMLKIPIMEKSFFERRMQNLVSHKFHTRQRFLLQSNFAYQNSASMICLTQFQFLLVFYLVCHFSKTVHSIKYLICWA
jgi:hypothetical protein